MYIAESQQAVPFRMRTDLVLNTGAVSKNGFLQNISLTQAIADEQQYQFAKIYQQQPLFDWQNASNINNSTAWRILVTSSIDSLNNNKGDLWDSKKQKGTNHPILYAGKPLVKGKVYYWKVQQWDEKNLATAFSEAASFYLSPEDSLGYFSHAPLTAEWETPISILNQSPGKYFLDFGKDAFSQLQLQISSDKSDSIYIEAAEALEGPQKFLTSSANIRYIKLALLVQKGTHDYQIQWPVNVKRNSRNPILMPEYIGEVYPFRYLGISGLHGTLNQWSVKRKNVFYPFNHHASEFVSSDTVLNMVWDLCKYSMKATSFSGFYVDGDRERVPYEADALINQLSHYAVDAEYSIARRTMAYLLFHPTWPTEWSLQNVLMAWNDFLYTGDKSFLQQYYPELQQKMLMPLEGEIALISTLSNKQTKEFLANIHITKAFDGKQDLKDIVDWPNVERDGFVFCQYNAVVNAFYYQNLLLMQKIALVMGKKYDAQLYQQKATKVFESYQKVFINPTTGLVKDGDSTNHTSLHSNMFALAFGLVRKEHQAAVIDLIKSKKMACSVYGSQFLLDALFDAGEADYALTLLTSTDQRSWYNMIRTGSTISMEAWDKKFKPNLDLNHAWGAAPANIIVRKLMGVMPLNPGADTILIKPQLGNLHFANLKTTLLKGEIQIDFQKKIEKNTYQLSIPSGITAMVEIAFILGKTSLWINGKKTNLPPKNGIYSLKNIGAGKHSIELR